MTPEKAIVPPGWTVGADKASPKDLLVHLEGDWISAQAPIIENTAPEMMRQAIKVAKANRNATPRITLDMSRVGKMDTAGAWMIAKAKSKFAAKGFEAGVAGAKPEQELLLDAIHYKPSDSGYHLPDIRLQDFLADIGMSMVQAGSDFANGVAFLGQLVFALTKIVTNPVKFRGTSLVFHIESFALRSVPIIALINFLVGCIVAQQGLYQLQRFGASTYAVDLIGILVLRELAVLLTSIMIAGRSGSAITAELGSMKMNEEIDALQVMGLDPMEVLVVPRVLALIVSLPLLTFVADMAALLGGLFVAYVYGGISPELFLDRLQDAIGLNTFLVGLMKAPFMALIIGLIACIEGFAVKGSAESLGRQVTASVVKAIFMVIVVDGLFAMFFVAIHY